MGSTGSMGSIGYQNVRILNTFPHLHYPFISCVFTIFKNFLSTIKTFKHQEMHRIKITGREFDSFYVQTRALQ